MTWNNIFLAGWTDWSNWTKCTVECGATGLKSRTRSCSEAEIGSKWCRCGASSPVISCVGCLTSDWSIMNKSETNISDIFIPGYHDESDLGYLQVEKCDACRKYRFSIKIHIITVFSVSLTWLVRVDFMLGHMWWWFLKPLQRVYWWNHWLIRRLLVWWFYWNKNLFDRALR